MATIKIKKGLESNRINVTPLEGEMLYTTDNKKVFIGDGSTAGGVPVDESANELLTKLLTVDGSGSGLDADTVDGIEGSQLLRNDQAGSIAGLLTVNDEVLEAINTIANNNSVNAVFLYDTSKDSDNGAWRDKCDGTSWYNEPLNTSTRGATREFPAIALIVAESEKITIYDATVSNMSMWMVFTPWTAPGFGDEWWRTSRTVTSVSCINGQLYFGSTLNPAGGGVGLVFVDFVKDIFGKYSSSSINGGVAYGLTTRGTETLDDSLPVIIGVDVNDVTVTVLPNAPIDTETGLPIPTIYVATDIGLSRISHHGTVSNWNSNGGVVNIVSFVYITDGHVYFAVDNSNSAKHIQTQPIYHELKNHAWNDSEYNLLNSSTNQYSNGTLTSLYDGVVHPIKDVSENSFATTNALVLFDLKNNDISKSSILTITNSFNSGWQYADIRGAWLSSNNSINLTNGQTEPDRSYNGNDLDVTGTIIKSPVATGSELMSYSGFSATNYLGQPYNSVLDFGTGEFHIMGWVKGISSGVNNYIFDRSELLGAYRMALTVTNTGFPQLYTSTDGVANSLIQSTVFGDLSSKTDWFFICAKRELDGTLSITINDKTDTSKPAIRNITSANVNAVSKIGLRFDTLEPMQGSLSLLRIGAIAPSDAQIIEIYESERHLFQENMACTLSSSTSDVNALDYDSDTELLHVAGADNLDTFDGLIRVDSEIGTYTSLSAQNGIIVKGN